jgi:hypothetical protein
MLLSIAGANLAGVIACSALLLLLAWVGRASSSVSVYAQAEFVVSEQELGKGRTLEIGG